VEIKDYSEEFRDITKSRIRESVPAAGITLLTQKSVSDDSPVRILTFPSLLPANSLTYTIPFASKTVAYIAFNEHDLVYAWQCRNTFN